MNKNIPINRVILEEGAERYSLTSEILRRVPAAADLITGVKPEDPCGVDDCSQDMDKNSLRLLDFPGEMLKACPGTTNYICCGYQILHVGTNCPLDCSYCILQAYFNQPSLRIFVNLEDKIKSILNVIDNDPNHIFRIGTGEFMDSLALDPIVDWVNLLLPSFSTRKNAVLELKTKTEHIDGLLSSPLRDRIIVSWSLNSPHVSSREEHRAPSVRKRLEAARRCQMEGYVLGFHFDPLIEHPGWEDGYKKTLDMMDELIDPEGIIWISMGTLRYMPDLKYIIRKRHPQTHILDGEFVSGLDGKMRYLKSIRIEMYAYMKSLLDQWHKDLGLYLCMESDEVWQAGMGWSVKTSEGLSDYLDNRVVKIFGTYKP
ncbi:MAG: radical SAM protein [Desulfatiglandales bacterium]